MHLYTLGTHTLALASRFADVDGLDRRLVHDRRGQDGRAQDLVPVYLLDEKGEPRLESTNDFLVWFCERCDIVTKKSVVEKAESWLKACGDLSRAKFNPDAPALRKGIFCRGWFATTRLEHGRVREKERNPLGAVSVCRREA